jgi:hypothetical protein
MHHFDLSLILFIDWSCSETRIDTLYDGLEVRRTKRVNNPN